MFNFTNKEWHPVDLPWTHLCVQDWQTIPVTTEQMQNLVLECDIDPACFVPILPEITIEDIQNLNINFKQKFWFLTYKRLPDGTCVPKWICYEENDDWTINPDPVWEMNVPDDCILDRRISPQG